MSNLLMILPFPRVSNPTTAPFRPGHDLIRRSRREMRLSLIKVVQIVEAGLSMEVLASSHLNPLLDTTSEIRLVELLAHFTNLLHNAIKHRLGDQ